MGEISSLRQESLVNLYDELSRTSDAEEISRIADAIAKIENAEAKETELILAMKDGNLRERELESRLNIEKLKSDTQLKSDGIRKKTEVIKGVGGVGKALIGGGVTVAMMSWILEQEKTGTITSKAYGILSKSFPKIGM